MLARAPPGGSACRTAPSCRRPTAGRPIAWSSLWPAGSALWCRAWKGAEDDEAEAERAVAANKIDKNDVVIGVAASGTTPYTIGVLRRGDRDGAVTIAVANNPDAPLFEVAQHRIMVDTGTEVIAGSTRMKAGTAQKIVLNLFSTAVMVRLGRVYRGLMVHMRARNAKLRRRAADGRQTSCAARRQEARATSSRRRRREDGDSVGRRA